MTVTSDAKESLAVFKSRRHATRSVTDLSAIVIAVSVIWKTGYKINVYKTYVNKTRPNHTSNISVIQYIYTNNPRVTTRIKVESILKAGCNDDKR